MLIFFLFQTTNVCFGQILSKNQICQFKLTSGDKINSNKYNSIVLFSFYILARNYPPWGNLLKKIEVILFS